ncbi:MAG: hypothetical protein JWO05_1008 [Gemmatimonadetes bacterium]|nr:hypothetical protein [Gemmatimonadota bacterium]
MSIEESTFKALEREYERVFGSAPEGAKHFLLLPLVGPEDALAFFRTVPSETPFDQLLPLASAYRREHPVNVHALESADPEAAI